MDYRSKYHGVSAGAGFLYTLFYVLAYLSYLRAGGENAFGAKSNEHVEVD